MTVYERFKDLSLMGFIIAELSIGEMREFLDNNKKSIDKYFMSLSSLKELTSIAESLDNIQLGSLIASLYDVKWSELYNILLGDILSVDIYSPYNIVETIDEEQTYNKNVKDNFDEDTKDTFEKTSTETPNVKVEQIGEGTSDSDYNTYGFNSSIPVPTDDNKTTANNEITTTTSGSTMYKDDHTNTNEKVSERIITDTGGSTSDGTKTIKGNIGNLTRDIISEGRIKLLKTNFIKSIIYDIDDVIALKYYGGF